MNGPPQLAETSQPVIFRPSPTTLALHGFFVAAVVLWQSWLLTIVAALTAMSIARWYFAVLVGNGEVLGPTADPFVSGRTGRRRIPLENIRLGPPPDYGPGYTIESIVTNERITTGPLSRESREELRRVLGLAKQP
ncbi:MAG: hypothetical protein OER77_05655 [Myxococcales bacterium]|nr:hypothetical protein [Myxococcales bacterium]